MIRQREAGYTLAELLVVLALLGMMALVMADGMRFGGRVWEASARKAEAIETMSGGQTLLRTVLERIVPRDLDPGIPGDPDLFRASPSRMTFLALAPAAIDAGGLSRFDLEVRAGNGGFELVMSWQPLAGRNARERRIAITGARAITFAYARRDQDGSLVWRNDWADQSGAPDLIMVRVTGQGRGVAPWPDLLVRPRISRDPTCIYDPVSFACRHA
jgi:prepilin-type N-terminal cleavage/methylation domain-containing protein